MNTRSQPRRHTRRQPRQLGRILTAALGPLAILLPVTVSGASVASAAPAAGYSASLIPTGESSYFVAVDPTTDTVYFADVLADEVTVVDGATNTVTATISVPGEARGVAVDPTTDTVYVSVGPTSTTSPASLDVIDGATNTVTTTVTLPAGSDPTGIAVDSSTDTVYVAEESAAAVAVIDGSTNAVTATVSTGDDTSRPYQLAVDETTDVVWVAEVSGDVLAISGASNSVTQTISLGSVIVEDVAVNPATDTVYAATGSGDGLAVIDGTTGTVSTTIAVTEPLYAVAVDPGSGTVFASTFDDAASGYLGTTWVIDATSNAITDTLERGGLGIAVDTGNGSTYAAPFLALNDAAWVLTPSAANATSPVITSIDSATFTVNDAGSFPISSSALPAATYTESGQLPAGVTLSASGVLSGTPGADTGGVYPITITASNGVAPDYSQAFTLTVDQLPSVTIEPSATVQVGTPVTIPMEVTGYPPVSSMDADYLPSGLAVTEPEQGSWAITGTPAVGSGGVYDTEIFATNPVGTTGAFPIDITVLEPPSITSAATTTFFANTNNNYLVSASGYPAATFTETGGLPAGVQLNANGLLQGDPPASAAGVYPFTVTATNSTGTATQAFTLTVVGPPAAAVGVEGTNGAMYVQAPQLSAGWHSEGGVITGPPAVAAPPNPDGTSPSSPLFLATGSTGYLYIRSLTAGWQLAGPDTQSCLGSPAAVITTSGGVSTLTVACEGTNQALYYNTATVPSSGLPQFTTGWTSLGGVLTAGPAIAPVGGTLTFFAPGTTGHIYTRTLSSGFAEQPWACIGAPAAALQAATGLTYFACQGTNSQLYEASSSGSGWTGAASLGGVLVGGPAIAATSQQVEFFVEGTTSAVYERTLTTGFTSLGGAVTGGAGATALN